ncbi:MAG: DUF2834 domain-containing protein [Cyanobacteria bacterium P01_C01_bin.120]
MFWSRVRQAIYAAATIAGVIWPGYFLAQFITATKAETISTPLDVFDLPTFVEQAWVTAASSFVAADLAIVLLIAIIFMVSEGRRLKLRLWGLYIGLIFLISFAFGFSLFMFVRERKLAASLEPTETTAEALSA